MNYDLSLLKKEEKVVFALRELYLKEGYKYFKMSKFLEYDFYSRNKDSLVSDGVITFTDTDGKLLALKPDVTLSIIKNYKKNAGVSRYFYNENVYRISKSTSSYKEIMQSGLECIGDFDDGEIYKVLSLAVDSLSKIDPDYRLAVSSIDFVSALMSELDVAENVRDSVLLAIRDKNANSLASLLTDGQYAALSPLLKTYSDPRELLPLAKQDGSLSSLSLLIGAFDYLNNIDKGKSVYLDFSYATPDGYYNGIVFKGFVGMIASAVVSGGQYDKLVRSIHGDGRAIGFAVYLDEIERLSESGQKEDDGYINVALPKGRLGEKIYSMFERVGLDCPSIRENTRKLTYESEENKIRFFWVKPSDVAIYVERGAADIGVAGRDILLEYTPDVYELLDLNEGKCRMAVAAKNGFVDDESKTLRVATKFSNIAKHFYNEKSRDIEIIHLNGSIELAPILGLSDVIVDIVETGKTLLENGLSPTETITEISARLISNKASYSFKNERIEEIKSRLSRAVVNEK